MATRHTNFVPLLEVSSDHMNKNQDPILVQRANGAANTMAGALDTTSTAHHSKRVGFALDFPTVAAQTDLDTSINYIDRYFELDGIADDWADIRPGKSGDAAFPKWRFKVSGFTSSGGITIVTPCSLRLYITPGGVLRYTKGGLYVYAQMLVSCQLKERT